MEISTFARGLVGLLAVLAVAAAEGRAQIPEEYTNLQVLPEDISRAQLVGYMRSFSRGTGIRCEGCHVAQDPDDFSTFDFASDEMTRKVKAREMLRMVQHINESYIAVLPDRDVPEIQVTCGTCHSGRSRPTTLVEEITWALQDGGGDAAVARYSELRERWYGLGTFNFGPRSLENTASAVGRQNPADALRIIDLNLEHHPESTSSWTIKGQLHGLLEQTEEAIAALERALELDPGNRQARNLLNRLRGGD